MEHKLERLSWQILAVSAAVLALSGDLLARLYSHRVSDLDAIACSLVVWVLVLLLARWARGDHRFADLRALFRSSSGRLRTRSGATEADVARLTWTLRTNIAALAVLSGLLLTHVSRPGSAVAILGKCAVGVSGIAVLVMLASGLAGCATHPRGDVGHIRNQ